MWTLPDKRPSSSAGQMDSTGGSTPRHRVREGRSVVGDAPHVRVRPTDSVVDALRMWGLSGGVWDGWTEVRNGDRRGETDPLFVVWTQESTRGESRGWGPTSVSFGFVRQKIRPRSSLRAFRDGPNYPDTDPERRFGPRPSVLRREDGPR